VQEQHLFFGVDVAKDELVIASHASKPLRCVIANEADSILVWLRGLEPGAVVAMESTGRYHQLLAKLAQAEGMQVYVLNARDVHYYAKALGTRSKTDKVDAGVIARFIAEHQGTLHAWTPGTHDQQLLQTLLLRRGELTKQRVSARQSMSGVKELAEASSSLQAEFERAIKKIDDLIAEIIVSDRELTRSCALVQGIPGIGAQTAAWLGGLFNRISFARSDALVAYAGLDPRANDSGKKRGARVLSKRGPSGLRRLLYLAAFAACRTLAFKPLYTALKAKGFASTEALVILARRLLRLAFAVWKSGKPFDASRLSYPQT
jgi:transposase